MPWNPLYMCRALSMPTVSVIIHAPGSHVSCRIQDTSKTQRRRRHQVTNERFRDRLQEDSSSGKVSESHWTGEEGSRRR